MQKVIYCINNGSKDNMYTRQTPVNISNLLLSARLVILEPDVTHVHGFQEISAVITTLSHINCLKENITIRN